jgi:glycerophosphoryl diester phosphodiesterase
MIVYGHRGARGEAPENTLCAFRHALSLGVRHVELDLRLSADRQVVVIHDDTVDRTCRETGKVGDFSAAELAGLDARSIFPDWPAPCGVPTLASLFETCPEFQHFDLEIKSDTLEVLEAVGTALIDLIGRFKRTDSVLVSSFDPEALRIVRRLSPTLPLGYIGPESNPRFLAEALEIGCAAICIELQGSSREMVAEAHGRSLDVYGWTLNEDADIATFTAWGGDAVITDYPSRVLPRFQQNAGGQG